MKPLLSYILGLLVCFTFLHCVFSNEAVVVIYPWQASTKTSSQKHLESSPQSFNVLCVYFTREFLCSNGKPLFIPFTMQIKCAIFSLFSTICLGFWQRHALDKSWSWISTPNLFVILLDLCLCWMSCFGTEPVWLGPTLSGRREKDGTIDLSESLSHHRSVFLESARKLWRIISLLRRESFLSGHFRRWFWTRDWLELVSTRSPDI